MKIKFMEKGDVGKEKLVDDAEEDQNLHQVTAIVCKRPAYGWCGRWMLTAVLLLVVTFLVCPSWVLLCLMQGPDISNFTPAVHVVYKDAYGEAHLGKFSWNNCGSMADPVKVQELKVSPDPVYLNQNISLTVKSYLDVSVQAPIKVVAKVKRRVMWFWLTVPCMYNLGSCTYYDVCQLTPFPAPDPCPDPFTKLNLPCRCPFEKGWYEVHNLVLNLGAFADIIPSWMESGDYYIHATAYHRGVRLGCYEVTTSID